MTARLGNAAAAVGETVTVVAAALVAAAAAVVAVASLSEAPLGDRLGVATALPLGLITNAATLPFSLPDGTADGGVRTEEALPTGDCTGVIVILDLPLPLATAATLPLPLPPAEADPFAPADPTSCVMLDALLGAATAAAASSLPA